MFYCYLLTNDRQDPVNRWVTRPISHVEIVKGRKDGVKRFEELCARHSDFLPPADDDGWHRITQRAIDAPDNGWIDAWKLEINRQLAALSVARYGARRMWPRSVGAPANWYPLPFADANSVLSTQLQKSGLYVPGG